MCGELPLLLPGEEEEGWLVSHQTIKGFGRQSSAIWKTTSPGCKSELRRKVYEKCNAHSPHSQDPRAFFDFSQTKSPPSPKYPALRAPVCWKVTCFPVKCEFLVYHSKHLCRGPSCTQPSRNPRMNTMPGLFSSLALSI